MALLLGAAEAKAAAEAKRRQEQNDRDGENRTPTQQRQEEPSYDNSAGGSYYNKGGLLKRPANQR